MKANILAAVGLLLLVSACGWRQSEHLVPQEVSIARAFLSGESAVGRSIQVTLRDEDPFSIDTRHLHLALRCHFGCPKGSTSTVPAPEAGIMESKRAEGSFPNGLAVTFPIPARVPSGVYEVAVGDYAVEAVGPPYVSIASGNRAEREGVQRRVTAQFSGKRIQAFGNLEVRCGGLRQPDETYEPFPANRVVTHEGEAAVNVGNEPSLQITSIERPLAKPLGDAQLIVIEPVLVRFALVPGCRDAHIWAADWELDRVLWAHDPVGLPEGTKITPGMTRLQVAHILGYPKDLADLDALNALNVWTYGPAPFTSSVTFDRNVVTQYRAAGMPP